MWHIELEGASLFQRRPLVAVNPVGLKATIHSFFIYALS